MPRVYDSTSGPLDFCKRHFPKSEDQAFAKYGDVGEGPDDRGNCFSYDACHPDYEGYDDMYRCVVCKKLLTPADD